MVAVEVRRALLELGKVFDRAQRALGAVYLLIEQAPQARGIQAEPVRLRAHIGSQVKGCIGMEVGVAVQTGDSEALVGALAILGLIEFLLGKGGQQQTQSFQLDGSDEPDHERVIVLDGEQLSVGHIAELGMGRQKYGRRKFRREPVGKIEIDIEAAQVALLLAVDLLDLLIRKHLPPGCLLDVRQGHESGRQQSSAADLIRRHRGKTVPRDPRGQPDPDTALNGLAAARHHDCGQRMIGQIVARIEQ